jgi:DMSO/TMAO reductase YedYZ molybdopterin-dependent catalytic subunit
VPTKKAGSFLTDPEQFSDVSRGKPKPYLLKGEDLVKAGLTPQTWRLEIVSDGTARLKAQRTLANGTAIDFSALEKLGNQHGVRFLKALQCLNIPQPLGQGLWEGVPLREVLKLAGKMSDCRRVYYRGFHNNDPTQLFQSSLSYSQAMETPPGELPAFVAYRLNGQAIPLIRGGPVRMIIPWAYGFKSIKWLQCITVTNDYRANDTYANANNDPESYLKTAAYIHSGPDQFKSGQAIELAGSAMVGWSGLQAVEYWLRRDTGAHGRLEPDDAAWETAKWQKAVIMAPPEDWTAHFPMGIKPGDVLGFDPQTGQPKQWPLRYSLAPWRVTLRGMAAGAYEFRVRAVDLNGYAQPEPRPYPKSGRNEIQCKQFVVVT